MMNNKWDKRFLQLSDHISKWSKDPTKKVGCVIIDNNKRVVATGYNGFPSGVQDYQEAYDDKSSKNNLIIHAEVNAILNATVALKGCTLYTNFFTCHECTKYIIQVGIKRVVSFLPDEKSSWTQSFKLSDELYSHANIGVTLYDKQGIGE